MVAMSTRSVLAVSEGPSWRGVYHRFDSHPWKLGNHLHVALLDKEGDLEALVHEAIVAAPGGWEWFPDRTRAESQPDYLDPDNIDDLGPIVEWFYLFSVSDRRLRIFHGDSIPATDSAPEPFWEACFDATGRAKPALVETPGPSWPAIPEAQDWQHDRDAARAVRDRVSMSMSGWCAERSVDESELRRSTCESLATVIDGLSWEPPKAGVEANLRERLGLQPPPGVAHFGVPADQALRMHFIHTGADYYWRLRLPRGDILYPTGAATRQRIDSLSFHRADGHEGRLNVGLEEAFLAAASRRQQALPRLISLITRKAPQQDFLDAFRVAVARALHPGSEIELQDGFVLQFKRVVSRVKDDATEVDLDHARGTLDPAADVDDEYGIEMQVHILWWLLDWIRQGQVPTAQGNVA
jgi:hypothetical protein